MSRLVLVSAIALVCLLGVSGCFGSSSSGFDFEPGTKFKETGNVIRLNAEVKDYDSEVFSGLKTYLWAFCFAPQDPADTYSANAIQYWTPLAGDKVVDSSGNPDPVWDGKCSVPGPTIHAKQGDRIIIEFTNRHFHPHTIHWHGQFVEPEDDGAPGVTQDAVENGGSYTYDFIAKRAGTLWYHCHVDTQTHVMQGLYGMIVIEPQDKTYEPKDVDREYNIVLSTMNRNMVEAVGSRHSHALGCASGFPDYNGVPCENPLSNAGNPDVFLLNGHSYPYTMDQLESLIVVKEGERVRLRILNAGETVEELHPHGHDMQVVAKDGNPLSPSSRYWVDTLKIGPAERYDVIIEANNPGPWMIHTHVSSHETNCGKAPGGMHTMLVYDGFQDKMHQFRSEAPVACPRDEILELPSDFSNSTSFNLNGVVAPSIPGLPPGTLPNLGQSYSWSWPIELVCAVRSVEFYAHVAQGTATSALTDVTLTIRRPDGTVADNGTLHMSGPDPDAAFVLKEHGLSNIGIVEGDFTVELEGGGSDLDVRLQAKVDYYETFEQSKIGHLTYKVGGCPGYT